MRLALVCDQRFAAVFPTFNIACLRLATLHAQHSETYPGAMFTIQPQEEGFVVWMQGPGYRDYRWFATYPEGTEV